MTSHEPARDGSRGVTAVIGGVVFLALLVLSAWIHPMEAATAENDGFVAQAEAVLRGSIPADPHRPLLYVLLTAGLGALVGDCFIAGRAVAAAGGALMVCATWLLGRDLFDRRTGFVAVGLLLVNGVFLTNSVVATTDAIFGALFLLTAWAAVRAARDPSVGAAAAVGALFGLAWFTRYTAVGLLPAIAVALLFGVSDRRAAALHGAVAAGSALVVVAPQGILSWISLGTPFHSETWRSVAFRHFGQGDWDYIANNPFDGLWSVLSHDPPRIARNAWETATSMFTASVPNLLWGNGFGAGPWSLVPSGAGLLILRLRDRKSSTVVALAIATTLGMLAASFFDWQRFELPVLPLLYVLCAGAFVTPVEALLVRLPARFVDGAVAILGFVCMISVGRQLPSAMRDFSRLHPAGEVAIARDLVARHGAGIMILSDCIGLDRAVAAPSVQIWPSSDPATMGASLQAELRRWPGADFLVLGRLFMGDRGFEALASIEVPSLELMHADDQVRSYRILHGDLGELMEGKATLAPSGKGVWLLVAELRADAPTGAALAAIMLGPERRTASLDLEPVGDRRREALATTSALGTGQWRVVMTGSDADGRLYRGQELSLDLSGQEIAQ